MPGQVFVQGRGKKGQVGLQILRPCWTWDIESGVARHGVLDPRPIQALDGDSARLPCGRPRLSLQVAS